MEKQRFSERAVNKVIEVILSRLVDADRLQVRIKTTLNRLTQGEVDAITIHIHGYLLQPNLRVEAFLFDIGTAAVNVKSAMRRKIELLHPSTGVLCLTLTETQFTDSLIAELHPLTPTDSCNTLDCVTCTFAAEGTIALTWQWSNPDRVCSGQWIATPQVNLEDYTVELASTVHGEPIPEHWLAPAIAHLRRTLNLCALANQGTTFQVHTIAIATGKATVQAHAHIDYVPSK
ncbi:LmeA family phospholipid-binding protein [Pantanalinema rosaneae CENA516]|uniref:LmeA family phospholipid-binding protein n=1 Tax=Pantanalinema rosaneae TaxID=1620701 RepID=UPI003D6E71CF